jgi:hypothetical protein
VLVRGQRDGGPSLPAPRAVDTGVDDDAVQPRGDRGVAAKRPGGPQRGDEGVLHGIRCFVRVTQRAQCDGPQPVPVPPDQLAERGGIAAAVRSEKIFVGTAASASVRARRIDNSASGRRSSEGW